jgi:hypothetical protein
MDELTAITKLKIVLNRHRFLILALGDVIENQANRAFFNVVAEILDEVEIKGMYHAPKEKSSDFSNN